MPDFKVMFLFCRAVMSIDYNWKSLMFGHMAMWEQEVLSQGEFLSVHTSFSLKTELFTAQMEQEGFCSVLFHKWHKQRK